MDLVSTCKFKLSHFRVVELKDVLTQLGLSKHGLKKDLVDRILESLKDKEVPTPHGLQSRRSVDTATAANIIDDIFRKMHTPGTKEVVVSKFQNNSVPDNEDPKEKLRVCCPCGITSLSDSMIMCENSRCQVWQHVACVLIPEKPTEQPEDPSCFFCELCRIKKADPFWVTMQHCLHPVKIRPSVLQSDGRPIVQITEKVFTLSKLNAEMLRKCEVDLQVWCLLLNDKVPFRMQWPQHAELVINGILVRVVSRSGTQLLGINGRDDGCLISAYIREGMNKISLSMCDARIFCIGVRLAKRQSAEQVLSLIPKEEYGEPFEAALARVSRCVGGDVNRDNSEGDSDLVVIAETVSVSLRCPMSGSRIRVAGRFKPCVHMGCFDLHTFVELNQRSRKWQCPICLKNYALDDLVIDSYFNRITSLLLSCEEDVTEIEIKPNGLWRAKGGSFNKWHHADGSLYAAAEPETKPESTEEKPVKQENSSESNKSLKIGIKRDRNGKWVVKKPADETPNVNGAEMSSKDSDIVILSDSEEEVVETVKPEDTKTKFVDTPKDPDIIVLSDSEENNVATRDEANRIDIGGSDDIDIGGSDDIDFGLFDVF